MCSPRTIAWYSDVEPLASSRARTTSLTKRLTVMISPTEEKVTTMVSVENNVVGKVDNKFKSLLLDLSA